MSEYRLSALALAAILMLLGGITVVGMLEDALPPGYTWMGHAAVHVWGVSIAAVIMVVVRRLRQTGSLPTGVVGMATRLAFYVSLVVATGSLVDAIGAYPAFEVLHDPATFVASMAGYLLIITLAFIAVAGCMVGFAQHRRSLHP